MNASVDSSVGGAEPWETRAPLGFAPTSPGAETQTWSLHASTADVGGGHLVDSKYGQCLNVVSFTGPDVGLDPCKEFGANDSNEMFAFQAIPGSTATTTAATDAATTGDADVVVAGALRGRRAPAAPEAVRMATSKLAMIRSYTTNVDGEQCKMMPAIFAFICSNCTLATSCCLAECFRTAAPTIVSNMCPSFMLHLCN